MTTIIVDRITSYTRSQLEAVIEVLESLDIDDWDAEVSEYGTCGASDDVEQLLDHVRAERKKRD